MQNYNNDDHKKVKVYKKDNNYQDHQNMTSRESDFINNYPVIFIIIEWGAIIIANMNLTGVIFGSILSIAAAIGGYTYSKTHQVHGIIMLIAAIICLIVQF